jgi:hypothetical protein
MSDYVLLCRDARIELRHYPGFYRITIRPIGDDVDSDVYGPIYDRGEAECLYLFYTRHMERERQ